MCTAYWFIITCASASKSSAQWAEHAHYHLSAPLNTISGRAHVEATGSFVGEGGAAVLVACAFTSFEACDPMTRFGLVASLLLKGMSCAFEHRLGNVAKSGATRLCQARPCIKIDFARRRSDVIPSSIVGCLVPN